METFPVAGDRTPLRRDRGLTLIELLVALAILSTITLLLSAAVHGLRRTSDGLLDRRKTLSDPRALLGELVREVESAWDPEFPDRPAFRIASGESGTPERWSWSFFTARPEAESDDPTRFALIEVRFAAVETGRSLELRRSERPAREPPGEFSAPILLLRGARELEVAADAGGTWAAHWPVKDGKGLPRKVRIRIVPGGDPETTHSVEILVPCSLVITPEDPGLP